MIGVGAIISEIVLFLSIKEMIMITLLGEMDILRFRGLGREPN